jgi:hypothetical protein
MPWMFEKQLAADHAKGEAQDAGGHAQAKATEDEKEVKVTNALSVTSIPDRKLGAPFHVGDIGHLKHGSTKVSVARKDTAVSRSPYGMDYAVILYTDGNDGRVMVLVGVDVNDLAKGDKISLSSAVKIIGIDEGCYVIQPVKLAAPPRKPTDAELAANKKAAEQSEKATAERAKAQEEREKAVEAAKWRTWVDASGTHKIEAKFGGVVAGTVKLTKRDGSTITIPLEKLSDEDQEWIKKRGK